MNVGAVLVADLQAPEAVEPGEGAFNHPAVAAQSVRAVRLKLSYLNVLVLLSATAIHGRWRFNAALR
jgi:hypothetical protein